MSDSSPYVPFSQRNGLSPMPPQLTLGEVTGDFRRLIMYAFKQEFTRGSRSGLHGRYFMADWERVVSDFHVKLLKLDADNINLDPDEFYELIREIFAKAEYQRLFDVIEFFGRHPKCSSTFKSDLTSVFEEAFLAYRLIPDGTIIAIGNEVQANAVLASLQLTEGRSANGARQHLLNSGAALRSGEWANSVRESIHAVEATAKMFAPSAKTLGEALSVLERKHEIHSALKKAFSQLYGYTNDEKGVRHALVLEGNPNVGEAEALFMLGACASFVSYLLTKMSEKE